MLVVGLAVAVFLSSCAPRGGLDVPALEADLVVSVLPDSPGVISGVDCPEPLDPEPGEQVLCTATIGRQLAEIELTFGAERGSATASVVSQLVAATEVERLVATQFVDDLGLTTTVDCGQPIVVVAADRTVRCTAIDHRGVERGLVIGVAPDGLLDVDLE